MADGGGGDSLGDARVCMWPGFLSFQFGRIAPHVSNWPVIFLVRLFRCWLVAIYFINLFLIKRTFSHAKPTAHEKPPDGHRKND